jgi:prefoldin subunit 5
MGFGNRIASSPTSSLAELEEEVRVLEARLTEIQNTIETLKNQ